MTANETPNTRSEEAVMPGVMTGNAADHGTLHAAARICGAGRQADAGQNGGCRDDHRFHHQILLVLAGVSAGQFLLVPPGKTCGGARYPS
jgi:hypothetical protein